MVSLGHNELIPWPTSHNVDLGPQSHTAGMTAMFVHVGNAGPLAGDGVITLG